MVGRSRVPAWKRPFMAGAGFGSRTSDSQTRSRPKKWRLVNSASLPSLCQRNRTPPALPLSNNESYPPPNPLPPPLPIPHFLLGHFIWLVELKPMLNICTRGGRGVTDLCKEKRRTAYSMYVGYVIYILWTVCRVYSMNIL